MGMDGSPPAGRRVWWRPTWYELVPELVLVAGLTWFLIDETGAATSAFKSGRAVMLMAAAVVVWLAARVLLARFVPWSGVRMAVFGVAAAGALTIVVLPAYDDKRVVEAFPLTVAPAVTPASTAVAVASTVPATLPATTVAPEPLLLRTGPFMGIDHRAAGTVSIYRASDGHHVVGLEDFDIQPGPDYDVYVVPGSGQRGQSGGVRLDDLRGNQGTQYYDVPAEADLASGDWTVLVWCQTFGVPVANSTPV